MLYLQEKLQEINPKDIYGGLQSRGNLLLTLRILQMLVPGEAKSTKRRFVPLNRGAGVAIHNPDFVNAIHNCECHSQFCECHSQFQKFLQIKLRKILKRDIKSLRASVVGYFVSLQVYEKKTLYSIFKFLKL